MSRVRMRACVCACVCGVQVNSLGVSDRGELSMDDLQDGTVLLRVVNKL